MGDEGRAAAEQKLATCHVVSPLSTMARLSSAPPSGRMMVWTASHALSTQAILSAKNSANVPSAAAASSQLLASTSRLWSCSGSAIQPKLHGEAVTKVTR